MKFTRRGFEVQLARSKKSNSLGVNCSFGETTLIRATRPSDGSLDLEMKIRGDGVFCKVGEIPMDTEDRKAG